MRARPLAALALLPLLPLLPLLGAAPLRAETVAGIVLPARVVTLNPLLDGVVAEVSAREGQRVARGDVLLRLDDGVQSARIALARAAADATGELRRAEVEAAEAAAVLARTRQAAAAGAARDWEVRQSQARLDAAQAALQTARERVEIERRRLALETAQAELHLLRAPFDGRVFRVEVKPGATVGRGSVAMTVADLTELEATLFVPARALGRLREGMEVPLALGEPVGRTVIATLRHVDRLIDAASGRFRAVFVLANADEEMPSGIEATLDLGALP